MRAAENRRLLPDVSNAVHVLDGPSNRYYLGFVDIFTTYGFRQKLGHLLKSIKHCGNDHSSANAGMSDADLAKLHCKTFTLMP